MTTPLDRSVHKQRQAIRRWLPQRRDDSGLTTLEWLLIVAAVAGLAALAVVLVQRVVGQTGEQIAGSSARKTAAQVAGIQITNQTGAKVPTGTLDAAAFLAATRDFQDDCNRIPIVFSDVDPLLVVWTYTPPATFTTATWDAAFDDPKTEGCVVT